MYILILFFKRDELFKVIDILENNFENKEWTDNELENVLMEFRYSITNTKSFYLVCILCIILNFHQMIF